MLSPNLDFSKGTECWLYAFPAVLLASQYLVFFTRVAIETINYLCYRYALGRICKLGALDRIRKAKKARHVCHVTPISVHW